MSIEMQNINRKLQDFNRYIQNQAWWKDFRLKTVNSQYSFYVDKCFPVLVANSVYSNITKRVNEMWLESIGLESEVSVGDGDWQWSDSAATVQRQWSVTVEWQWSDSEVKFQFTTIWETIGWRVTEVGKYKVWLIHKLVCSAKIKW